MISDYRDCNLIGHLVLLSSFIAPLKLMSWSCKGGQNQPVPVDFLMSAVHYQQEMWLTSNDWGSSCLLNILAVVPFPIVWSKNKFLLVADEWPSQFCWFPVCQSTYSLSDNSSPLILEMRDKKTLLKGFIFFIWWRFAYRSCVTSRHFAVSCLIRFVYSWLGYVGEIFLLFWNFCLRSVTGNNCLLVF